MRRPDAQVDRIDPLVWKIAGVVMLGPLMSNLDSTIVNLSLSTLSQELHTTLTTIQWVTSGYLLALALTLPLSGWIVDRVGAKNVYLICFAAFTVTSLLCGVANSAGSLIFFRILQGTTGGLLAPMSQMMMARVAGRNVPRVMGIAVMPVMIGPILGPALAGAILQHANWRWIFFINLPVGILSLWLAWRILPADAHETQRRRFDLPGFLLLSPALVLLLNSLDRLGVDLSHGGSSIIELLVAIVMLTVFYRRSLRRGAEALIDLSLFRDRTFGASASTQFLSNALMFGGQMLFPLYLLMVTGRAPSDTGALLASSGIGMLCVYPLLGRLVERFGPRRISTSGTILALVGTLPFAFTAIGDLSTYGLCILLLIRGIGLGAVNIPSISAAYASIPRERIPVATTAINIVQRLGGPVATTLLAICLHFGMSEQPSDIPHAFAMSFRVFCILHTLAILAANRLPVWAANRMPASASAEAMGD